MLKMLSSGCDEAVILMNSLQLELPAQHLYKTEQHSHKQHQLDLVGYPPKRKGHESRKEASWRLPKGSKRKELDVIKIYWIHV